MSLARATPSRTRPPALSHAAAHPNLGSLQHGRRHDVPHGLVGVLDVGREESKAQPDLERLEKSAADHRIVLCLDAIPPLLPSTRTYSCK